MTGKRTKPISKMEGVRLICGGLQNDHPEALLCGFYAWGPEILQNEFVGNSIEYYRFHQLQLTKKQRTNRNTKMHRLMVNALMDIHPKPTRESGYVLETIESLLLINVDEKYIPTIRALREVSEEMPSGDKPKDMKKVKPRKRTA